MMHFSGIEMISTAIMRPSVRPAVRPVVRACVAAAAAVVLITGLLGGCNRSGDTNAATGVRQTKFPGQYTAGGETSGRVLTRNASAGKATATTGSATQSPQEGMRGQPLSGNVAGTPGIPEGAGGTTSGTAMGGTSPGAAATRAAPSPGSGTPAIPDHSTQK